MTDSSTVQVSGRVKWYNEDKGFGFIVTDQGDVLVHVSRLREHKRKSLPEGALVVAEAHHGERGMQADKVLSIDISYALPPRECRKDSSRVTAQPHGEAGPFELLPVRWFNGLKGYGFLDRNGEDVFVHAATVHAAGLKEIWPDDLVEARIAFGAKGMLAVELRQPEAEAIAA